MQRKINKMYVIKNLDKRQLKTSHIYALNLSSKTQQCKFLRCSITVHFVGMTSYSLFTINYTTIILINCQTKPKQKQALSGRPQVGRFWSLRNLRSCSPRRLCIFAKILSAVKEARRSFAYFHDRITFLRQTRGH